MDRLLVKDLKYYVMEYLKKYLDSELRVLIKTIYRLILLSQSAINVYTTIHLLVIIDQLFWLDL